MGDAERDLEQFREARDALYGLSLSLILAPNRI
jgi:hypothetical protein